MENNDSFNLNYHSNINGISKKGVRVIGMNAWSGYNYWPIDNDLNSYQQVYQSGIRS